MWDPAGEKEQKKGSPKAMGKKEEIECDTKLKFLRKRKLEFRRSLGARPSVFSFSFVCL